MIIRSAWAAAAAISVSICAGPALAASISILPQSGVQEMIDDAGGNSAPWGLPVLPAPSGLTGYSSLNTSGAAPVLQLTPGRYVFTYIGSGDALDTDAFTVNGVGGFTFNNHSTALGTSVTYTVGSTGLLSFTYANLTAGTSISSGTMTPTTNLAYGLFMQGSTGCTTANPDNGYACPGGSPLTGPGSVAYIGLSDLPTGDHDFQDLGVRVTAIPEPATWGLLIIGLGIAGSALRMQRRAGRLAA